MAITPRYFAVASLRTQGPSNRVRGEFLVEFTGATAGAARVWNAKRRAWTRRIVDVLDVTQCADWRLAHASDLERFRCAYTGPLG